MVILQAGCTMIGPDFRLPEATVTDHWSAQTGGITRQPVTDSQWWQIFNDPVLDSLVETARAQNLSLRIAGLRVLEARAQLGIVTGNLYPQSQALSGNYSFNRSRETPATDKYFSQLGTGFDAAWELDFWGKFRRGIESADANLLASIASYDDVLVTLTAEVARNYVLVRTLEERIRVARENIAQPVRDRLGHRTGQAAGHYPAAKYPGSHPQPADLARQGAACAEHPDGHAAAGSR
jgi:outer membrane protein TolC